MKNFFLAIILLGLTLGLQAQEQGRVRVAGNLGYCTANLGAGMSVDLLDIRYNVLDNMNVGIKFGGAMLIRDIHETSYNSGTATVHVNTNVMFEGDYYFHNGTSSFAPFAGVGIGSFGIYNMYMEIDPSQQTFVETSQFPLPNRTIGGAIRGGFELGRFRLAMEYYLIPPTAKYDIMNNMQEFGTSRNSYLTVNLGFYFGGGRWHRKI